MRTQIRFLAVATVIATACVSSIATARADTAAGAGGALAEVDSWLGTGATAEGWDRYLNLSALREQLERGDQADLKTVQGVLEKLNSAAPGLERPRFARLRDAVGQWADELVIVQAPSLSEAVLSVQDEFRPLTDEDVATSKAALQTAADKLDRYLTGANGAAWKKYLGWQELETQLTAENPDLEVLAGVYHKLTADQVGLELPVFANVADALERYVNDLVGHSDKLREQFDAQVQGLAEALKQYQEDPSDDNAVAVGSRLGWLESMRQAPALVKVLRGRLSRPNLFLKASERLVGAGIIQPLDEVTPVRDYILGTSIQGNGRLVGTVTVELVPSDDAAVLDTMLRGAVNSRTVGYNGPATIYSNGATAIAGRKRVVIDEKGFTSYPATAAANTNTRVTGIGGSGLVQRVASRRVGEQKSQAERIAADHAADRVRRRMDSQVGEQLSKSHADYNSKFRNPLLRRREFPALRFRTTADDLFLNVLAANSNQIGAPTAPPDTAAENDLAVQIHESMINNLAAALFGGVTLEEEALQQKVVDLRGSLPDSLKSDEDRDPWSITFARSRPVTVKFGDGGALEITIRGQRYTSGDQDFRAMNVTADYKIAIADPDEQGIHGIKLTRQGDLKIVPPGEPRRLSGREITLRTLLEKRFGKLFEPEVTYDGLILPGRSRAGRHS